MEKTYFIEKAEETYAELTETSEALRKIIDNTQTHYQTQCIAAARRHVLKAVNYLSDMLAANQDKH